MARTPCVPWAGAAAVTVGLLDLAKGALPILVARLLGAPVEVQALTGVAAVLGAWKSVFLRFHGGRGVATGVGRHARRLARSSCLIALRSSSSSSRHALRVAGLAAGDRVRGAGEHPLRGARLARPRLARSTSSPAWPSSGSPTATTSGACWPAPSAASTRVTGSRRRPRGPEASASGSTRDQRQQHARRMTSVPRTSPRMSTGRLASSPSSPGTRALTTFTPRTSTTTTRDAAGPRSGPAGRRRAARATLGPVGLEGDADGRHEHAAGERRAHPAAQAGLGPVEGDGHVGADDRIGRARRWSGRAPSACPRRAPGTQRLARTHGDIHGRADGLAQRAAHAGAQQRVDDEGRALDAVEERAMSLPRLVVTRRTFDDAVETIPVQSRVGGAGAAVRGEEDDLRADARAARWRAATKPSPPLLPAPQRMSTRAWAGRSAAASSASAAAATAAPACSMSHSPGVPRRWARRSAPRISSAVIEWQLRLCGPAVDEVVEQQVPRRVGRPWPAAGSRS